MKYIENEVLQVDVITQVSPTSRWVSCYSCRHAFEPGEKKIKWRTHLTGTNPHQYVIWHLQCKQCAIDSMQAIMTQLSVLNYNTISNM